MQLFAIMGCFQYTPGLLQVHYWLFEDSNTQPDKFVSHGLTIQPNFLHMILPKSKMAISQWLMQIISIYQLKII